MNALTRWDPFRMTRWDPLREMDEMQRRMDAALGRVPLRLRTGEREEAVTPAEWAPLVDIIEDEKEYVVKAEIPEINKENLRVAVQNDTLILSGERRLEKEEKGKKYHRVERSYGSFMRSFTLPEDADAAKVAAEFKDGVLRVRLPKTEKARPKAIEVKIA